MNDEPKPDLDGSSSTPQGEDAPEATARRFKPSHFWLIAAAVATAAAGGVFLWLFLTGTLQWADVWRFIEATRDWMAQRPLLFFLAIVILPAFPIPLSPLLLMAGAVFEPRFGLLGASAVTILALALNMAWSYWAAAGPARNLVQFLLKRFSTNIPSLPPGQALQLLLILRMTPGIPFFLHNLVLGFLRVPFASYLIISTLIIGSIAVGWIISGGALMDGRVGMALLGVGIILMVAFATRIIGGRIRRRRKARPDGTSA